jgi:hypothetical protein
MNAQIWAQCCPLQAITYPQECRGPCGSHKGLQGRCGRQKPDLREGRGWRPQVSQWVMLLLLLNPTPLSRVEGDLESKGPCPLRSSPHHLLRALMPPLEAITPSRLQPLDFWGGQGPPSAPVQPPRGAGSTASMPCRAITLYLFLGSAREVQGHGASQGPELLAVQRLYFNVYLLQRETAFGFEPLMRKKNILWSSRTTCVPCVTGSWLGHKRGE